MTAPTSPDVVPADVLVAAREALAAQFECSVGAFPYHPKRIRGGIFDHTYEIKAIVRAIMADRANRPSLTEDEREQVRREATEDERDRLFASVQCSPNAIIDGRDDHWRSVNRYWLGDQGAMLPQKRVALRRALADRSEPRQEKEGDRG